MNTKELAETIASLFLEAFNDLVSEKLKGRRYYYVSVLRKVERTEWLGAKGDRERLQEGNVFFTEESADEALKEIRTVVKAAYAKHSRDTMSEILNMVEVTEVKEETKKRHEGKKLYYTPPDKDNPIYPRWRDSGYGIVDDNQLREIIDAERHKLTKQLRDESKWKLSEEDLAKARSKEAAVGVTLSTGQAYVRSCLCNQCRDVTREAEERTQLKTF